MCKRMQRFPLRRISSLQLYLASFRRLPRRRGETCLTGANESMRVKPSCSSLWRSCPMQRPPLQNDCRLGL